MIPYYPEPEFHLGPIAVHAFGVSAAAALLAGYGIVNMQAERHGLRREAASWAYLMAVVSGLLGGFLWGALISGHSISATGVALGGVGSLLFVFGFRQPRGSPKWRALDLFGFALPFVMAIARVGCFLVHDHPGNPTVSWLGVGFPGGTRFDLGLLYAIASALIAIFLLLLNRASLPAGALSLITVSLLAATRLAILPLGPAKGADYAIAAAVLLVCATVAVRTAGRGTVGHYGTESRVLDLAREKRG